MNSLFQSKWIVFIEMKCFYFAIMFFLKCFFLIEMKRKYVFFYGIVFVGELILN